MHRVMLNDDCTWYWDRFVEDGADREPDGEIARRYVRQYKDSGLTDYFVNINGQYSFTPSRVMEICEDIYQKTDMGGIPVDFKSIPRYTAWHNHYVKGIDVYGEIIDECNKIGISPWISIRMNDIHCSRKDSPHGEGLRSMFLHTAHERGLMRDSHRDIVGYYDETLDYGKEEVRRLFIDYIKEQLLQYDVAGVELDFMREVYCFRVGYEDEGREIMRGFMREIREGCLEAEKKHGHPVRIAIRCLTDPLNDRYSGVYGLGLAREGLVDMLIPSPRWETSYDRIPIDMWKELLPKECLVISAYEVAHTTHNKIRQRRSDAQLFGMCHKDLSMGADGIYLFNNIYLYKTMDPEHVRLYNILSDREKLAKAQRRNTVSYQDIAAPGFQRFGALPLKVENIYYSTLYIETGFSEKPMYILLDIDREDDELKVYCNSVDVKYIGKAYVEKNYTENPVLVYETKKIRPITQAIEIRSIKDSCTVNFAEMRTEKPMII